MKKGYLCLDGKSNNSKHKILLVYPKTGADAKGFSLHVPLSLLYLASNIKDFSVAIYDQRVDSIDLYYKLLEEKPLCVGISTMTGEQIKFALQLAQIAKDKNITTVFGGIHPTLLPKQTSEDNRVDFVIAGEGEISFRKLVKNLSKEKFNINRIVNSEIPDINDISIIKSFDHVDTEQYISNHVLEGRCLPYQFSRGCPHGCTFCCNTILSKRKWRCKNIDIGFKEVELMAKKYKLDSIWFIDENLTVDKKKIMSLAVLINNQYDWYIQSRANSLLNINLFELNKFGLKGIGIGLESGSQKILNQTLKDEKLEEYIEANIKLAETNITVWYNYMMGFPNETIEDLYMTIDLALNMIEKNPNAYNNTFYLLSPYPGTYIGDNYYSEYMPKTLGEWALFGRHNIEAPWHNEQMKELYKKIMFSSKFVGKKLQKKFPNNTKLNSFSNMLKMKWENKDFEKSEWEDIMLSGKEILKELFGEHAY